MHGGGTARGPPLSHAGAEGELARRLSGARDSGTPYVTRRASCDPVRTGHIGNRTNGHIAGAQEGAPCVAASRLASTDLRMVSPNLGRTMCGRRAFATLAARRRERGETRL